MAGAPQPTDSLVGDLSEVVGAAHVIVDDDVRAPFEADWTGRWRGRASVVVRPADTREVAAVVAACSRAGAAVVTQGGNTGLVGGAVPRDGAVLLSTRRLDALGDVDVAAAQVTVGAGATLAATQAHVAAHGLAVGVDLAARDTATIGGMAATNAGGVHVVAHGMMRDRVAGVEAVLADGTVLDELSGLDKDNTGYDLTGLLVGSEGTLGVLTRVRLRLPPLRRRAVVALLALPDLDAAVGALPALRTLPSLHAVEWIDPAARSLLGAHTALPPPPGADGPLLLVEAAADHDPTEELAAALAEMPGAADAAVGTEPDERARLWAYREHVPDAVAAEAAAGGRPPRKLDVTVPLDRLVEVTTALPALVADLDPGARVAQFGHLADGNVHVQLLHTAPGAGDAAEDAVLERVVAAGGSVSAEHGVGAAKPRWLARSRSPEAVAAMRAVKTALDPDGHLNPGVLLPPV